VEYSVSGTT